MKMLKLPPTEFLREHLRYVPETGELWWKIKRRGRQFDSPAGSVSEGYVDVCIDYKKYAAHRIIWKIVTGKDPKIEVDHKNLKGTDNRWKNLRESTVPQNRWNARKRRDNTSGYKGVSWADNKWHVKPWMNGKPVYVGGFSNKKDAHAAYKAFIKKHRGEFARV